MIDLHEAKVDFLDAVDRRPSGKAFDFRKAQRDADGWANSDLLSHLKRSPAVRRVGLVMRAMWLQIKAIPGREPVMKMTNRTAAKLMGRYLPDGKLDHRAGRRALVALVDAKVIEFSSRGKPREKGAKGESARFRYICDDLGKTPESNTPF